MKKHIIFLMIAILMTFVFTLILNAQEGRGTGRLLGEVMDKDKKPIEGVKVTLEYQNFNYRLETISDKKGQFGFTGLGMGNIRISAEKDGYLPTGIGTNVSGVSRNPKVSLLMYSKDDKIPGEQVKLDEQVEKLKSEFDKATALFKDAKFEAALAIFQDLRTQKPEIYTMGINIGCCLVELQKYDEALNEFQVVLDKILAENKAKEAPNAPAVEVKEDPNLAKVYASIGDVYMRQDKFDQAQDYFKKSIALSPTEHTLPYNVAEILFAAGKTDEAIPYYQLAAKIKPDWPKAYMQLGYAFLNKGDIKAATESFKKFLELAPTSPEAAGVKEVLKSLQ